MGTTAVVLGASGYSGGELLRLLAGHPAIDVLAVAGDSRAGEPLHAIHPHLAGTFDLDVLKLDDAVATGADVCFSCLPSGSLPVDDVDAEIIVDLSDDHRADSAWAYGLTEFVRGELDQATFIANPGCYPTATLLGLVPYAGQGLIEGPVIVDAMSGYSGAGRKGTDRLLLASGSGNVEAYGTVDHRHVPEIERGLNRWSTVAGTLDVSFTPHLVPTARGLLVTARAPLARTLTDEDALDVLTTAYKDEPFVHVVTDWPGTKAVLGTNRAHVSARVDDKTDYLIVSSAIDNLGKGAAGQALQNANVSLGIEETTGLESLGVWP